MGIISIVPKTLVILVQVMRSRKARQLLKRFQPRLRSVLEDREVIESFRKLVVSIWRALRNEPSISRKRIAPKNEESRQIAQPSRVAPSPKSGKTDWKVKTGLIGGLLVTVLVVAGLVWLHQRLGAIEERLTTIEERGGGITDGN